MDRAEWRKLEPVHRGSKRSYGAMLKGVSRDSISDHGESSGPRRLVLSTSLKEQLLLLHRSLA